MFVIKPCFLLLALCHLGLKRKRFLIKGEGVAPQGSFLAHVFLTEVLHASLSLLHLLWCHALEGLLTVSVHVDGELVDEVFGLYVGSIRLQDVPITTRVHVLGLAWCHQWWDRVLVVCKKILL